MVETSANAIRMSFSGQDADVYMFVGGPGFTNQTPLIRLDAIQTISVSVYRDKVPVRAIGYSNVKGHSRGSRAIAGSMIFAVMNDNPLWSALKNYDYDFTYDQYAGQATPTMDNIYSDMIPPFNFMIVYQNELGSAAVATIIGIDITNDGLVTSVEDLLTEKAIQYKARDYREFQAVEGANLLEPRNPYQTLGDVYDLLLGRVDSQTGEVTTLSDILGEDPSLLYDNSHPQVPQSTGQSLAKKLWSFVG